MFPQLEMSGIICGQIIHFWQVLGFFLVALSKLLSMTNTPKALKVLGSPECPLFLHTGLFFNISDGRKHLS